MAGRPGSSESEAMILKTICKPNNCVYSRFRNDKNGEPRCGTKYPDEAVEDFAGDGCMTAAIPTADGNPDHIIPGTMTHDGFTPFSGAPAMTISDHGAKLKSEFYPQENRGKVVYKG